MKLSHRGATEIPRGQYVLCEEGNVPAHSVWQMIRCLIVQMSLNKNIFWAWPTVKTVNTYMDEAVGDKGKKTKKI